MGKLVQNILNTDYGDWNLDGSVDLADFNECLRGDGRGGCAGGDGNKDGIDGLTDFNIIIGNLILGGAVSGPRGGVNLGQPSRQADRTIACA